MLHNVEFCREFGGLTVAVIGRGLQGGWVVQDLRDRAIMPDVQNLQILEPRVVRGAIVGVVPSASVSTVYQRDGVVRAVDGVATLDNVNGFPVCNFNSDGSILAACINRDDYKD